MFYLISGVLISVPAELGIEQKFNNSFKAANGETIGELTANKVTNTAELL